MVHDEHGGALLVELAIKNQQFTKLLFVVLKEYGIDLKSICRKGASNNIWAEIQEIANTRNQNPAKWGNDGNKRTGGAVSGNCRHTARQALSLPAESGSRDIEILLLFPCEAGVPITLRLCRSVFLNLRRPYPEST